MTRPDREVLRERLREAEEAELEAMREVVAAQTKLDFAAELVLELRWLLREGEVSHAA